MILMLRLSFLHHTSRTRQSFDSQMLAIVIILSSQRSNSYIPIIVESPILHVRWYI